MNAENVSMWWRHHAIGHPQTGLRAHFTNKFSVISKIRWKFHFDFIHILLITIKFCTSHGSWTVEAYLSTSQIHVFDTFSGVYNYLFMLRILVFDTSMLRSMEHINLGTITLTFIAAPYHLVLLLLFIWMLFKISSWCTWHSNGMQWFN